MVFCEGDAFSKALLRLPKEIGPLLRVIDILRKKSRPQISVREIDLKFRDRRAHL